MHENHKRAVGYNPEKPQVPLEFRSHWKYRLKGKHCFQKINIYALKMSNEFLFLTKQKSLR